MNDLAMITGNLNPSGIGGYSLATINSYRGTVNAAAEELTGATSAEQSVSAAWSAARDSLSLEKAGSTDEDILAVRPLSTKQTAWWPACKASSTSLI